MLVAMENQKNILDAVEKTKQVTNELIVNNAKRLNEQGSAIYEQSAKSTLDTQKLQEAFTNIDEAISKVNTLKAEALAQTKQEIDTMKNLSEKLAKKIEEAQKAEAVKAAPLKQQV